MLQLALLTLVACGGSNKAKPPSPEPTPPTAPAPAAEAPAPPAPAEQGGVPECPDTETKSYVAAGDECNIIDYDCLQGELFRDDCGCGCTIPAGDPPTDEAPSEPPTPTDAEGSERCGGIAGFTCPEGKRCIDDPSDDCEPGKGGADCMGICVGNQVPECPDTETKRYIATMEMCKRIRYRCAASEKPFGDDCGCGCEVVTDE